MSLFPAYTLYGDGGSPKDSRIREEESNRVSQREVELVAREAAREAACEAAREAALLASDSAEEEAPAPPSPPAPPAHFYFDGKADGANLGVTTLYVPGRPIYKRSSTRPLGSGGGNARRGQGARRYYLQPAPEPPGPAADAAERARALRRLLADAPRDERLWLRYIDFQEEWADGDAWRAAAEAARAAGATGARLRAALHRARCASLPPSDLLQAVSGELTSESRSSVRLEGWLRLLWTVAEAGGPAEVRRAGVAALAAMPRCARAYPLVLFVYGAALRAAGLWEQLVLLVELVCAVNFPASAGFPPAAERQDAERRLQAAEDKVIDSGLPLSTVWVRVERLRSAAHWRPLAAARAPADGQRAPCAADVQDLVRGGSALLLCVSALRLARVPLLPLSETALRACGAGAHDAAEDAPAALCALHRALRRTPPPAHHVHPSALQDALAALHDPPHYFTDEAGFLTWVSALWEACCEWSATRRRPALACWRLRWLHALARCAPPEEARRLRAQARQTLKRHAPAEPVAFALFARIEADVGAAETARRAALQAVRAACAAGGGEGALFAARVAAEVCAGDGGGPAARWALCAAATATRLPPDAELGAGGPPPQLREDALRECSRRCSELERRFESAAEEAQAEETQEDAEAAAERALTCGAGEWGAARVRLLEPGARAALRARLLDLPYETIHRSAKALQYYESCACALAAAAGEEGGARRGGVARSLLPLFPNNAFLALAARADGVASAGRASGAAPTARGALAHVVRTVLRAPLTTAGAQAAGRVARACARAGARGAGGAALASLRLEAEARSAPAVRTHRLLLAALHAHPYDKSLYVRGAAWVPAQAEALCDAALERALRVHALPHELRALHAPGTD